MKVKLITRKGSLKDWCDEWTVAQIIDNAISEGMAFQVGMKSVKELKQDKKIMVAELEKRQK